jgi:hypothetical protein
MDDLDKSELLTEQMETSVAETRELPRALPIAHNDDEDFGAGQSKILEMIAAHAPLGEILTSLVLLPGASDRGAIRRDALLCSAAQR